MSVAPRPHPPALPHGELSEVLPEIFVVTGTIKLPGAPVKFSRNMTVIRRGDRLVIVNSVRLDERGLAALDKLGKVTDVIRIAANHGSDDPFYAEHYGAKVWVVKGQRYTAGFDTNAKTTYFTPHHELDAATAPPLDGAKLVTIDSLPPEGLLLLPDHGGTLISGDCLQNWGTLDPYCNVPARIMMPLLGFKKPYNVGPAWLKQGKPPKIQLRELLDLPFANVMPAHGTPVIGGARDHYRPAIERVSA